jgi:hypothetical protein
MQTQAGTFEKAIAAAKSGDKTTARKLLSSVIAKDPDNELAWMWLAYCAGSKAERRLHLERVLEINPANVKVRKALEELIQTQRVQAVSPIEAVRTTKPEQRKQAEQAAQNKPSGCTYILVVLIAIVGAIWIFGDFGDGSGGGSDYERSSDTYSIKYRVSGTTTRASLTYENESSNTEQIVVSLPWSESFTAEKGQFLYISAQNEKGSGSIKCEILQGGEVIEEATSSGAYVIASCSGSAGD